jgi:hypothetical protein
VLISFLDFRWPTKGSLVEKEEGGSRKEEVPTNDWRIFGSIHDPRITERSSGHDGKRGAASALEVLILQLLNGGQVVAHARLIVVVLAREFLVCGDVGFIGHHERPVGNESLYALVLHTASPIGDKWRANRIFPAVSGQFVQFSA